MATNFAGSLFRLYPWQVKHYLIRGGPFDPAIPSTGNAGSLVGGYLNAVNALSQTNQITLPPVPGTQSPPNIPLPRVQSMNSTGTYTAATGTLATNNGGVYLGTIPGAAWIESVEVFAYTALAGGSTNFGVFYTPSENQVGAVAPGFQPATLYALAVQNTAGAAGALYSTRYVGATLNNATFTSAGLVTQFGGGWQVGPGLGPSGSTWPTINVTTLASDGPPGGQGTAGIKDLLAGGVTSIPGDIDLYFVTYGGAAPTAGNFAVKVEFTGLMG